MECGVPQNRGRSGCYGGSLKRFIYPFLPTVLSNIDGKSNDDGREKTLHVPLQA